MTASYKPLNMIPKILRHLIHFYNRLRLRNRDFTLITNTCIGGIMYHELKLRFLSPTINCGIRNHEEFFTFCRYLEHYLSLPLDFIPSQWKYPVAVLHGEHGDITVYFTHYHSQAEAQNKWEERKKRVNPNNTIILMDGDNCTEQQVKAFDSLPQKHKVIITMTEYPEIKSVWAITHPDYRQAQILEYGLWNHTIRWYELFDYVHFFNTGKIRNNALFHNKKENHQAY